MVKRRMTLLLVAAMLVLSALAQTSVRLEGIVSRINKQQSTFSVRASGSSTENVIHYDSSTQFTSAEHGSKKINDIDASRINDGDRVICLGFYDKKGEFQAALISKRLSH